MATATETTLHSTRPTSGKLFSACRHRPWVWKLQRCAIVRIGCPSHRARPVPIAAGAFVSGPSKSVRTCDDCVDTNVHNISEITQHQSTSKFLRSKSSPAVFESYDTYERRSLQNLPVRPASNRILHYHQSMETSSMTSLKTATSTSKRAKTFSSKEMAGMKCHLTISSQTRIVSLVLVAIVVLIVCIIKLVVQV